MTYDIKLKLNTFNCLRDRLFSLKICERKVYLEHKVPVEDAPELSARSQLPTVSRDPAPSRYIFPDN